MSKMTLKIEGDTHVVVTRRFAAAPKTVFRAHTEAALMQKWLLGPEGCKDNLVDSFDQIHFWRTPEAKCGDRECVPYSRWTEDYLKLIGG